jgi:CheY-like chemotaxis protein
VAEEAAWRAAEAVRDLLGFGPGLRGGEIGPLDLAEVVRAAVEEAPRRWAERGVEATVVELALEPLPPVRGSGEDLREALGQLLANAGEAGGGVVRLRAGWDGGGSVELVVEDAGGGMEEAVRARALEPFFSTKGHGRLGLGLAIAQAIVARHRGALHLESTPGRGTRVRMTLPTAAGTVPGGARPSSAPARVLVIEADRAVRDALVAVLEQQGHVALGAPDGDTGLAIVRREALDAVVTDWALPTLSGIDVARATKRIQPGSAVILVTAWPGRLDPAAVRESGIDRVVEKPVGAARLAEALDAALARSRQSRA